MPLESIVQIGGALLGIVVATVVGSLLGRRLRSWRETCGAPPAARSATASIPSAASNPRPASQEGMAATAVILREPAGRRAGEAAAQPIPGAIALAWDGVTAAVLERSGRPPTTSGAAFALDPLARTAIPRDGTTYSSSAEFGRRVTIGTAPVASRATSSLSPAMRDRNGVPLSDPVGQRAAGSAQPARRDRRRAVLALATGSIVVAGGAIFAGGALRPQSLGEMALATGAPATLPATASPTGRGWSPTSFPPVETRGVRAIAATTSRPGEPAATGGDSDAAGGGDGTDGRATDAPRTTPVPTPTETGGPTPTGTPSPTGPPTPEPTAAPTATPKVPVVAFAFAVDGLTVTFANRTRNAATWRWTFGDGASSTARNPVHAYDSPGAYTVTLTGTSVDGVSDSASHVVTTGD